MIKGETKSGFKFEIDETIADDMEFLEALAEAQDDVTRFPKVIEALLGKDQKKALYEHVKGNGKRVSIEKTVEEFTDIMNTAGEQTKNS